MSPLAPFIARAPWIADDIRSEAVVCELEGLSDERTRRRLWRLVYGEWVANRTSLDLDRLVDRSRPRLRKHPRRLTPKESRRFYRDVAIQFYAACGVTQRTLAVIYKLPHSRIAVICALDLHERLAVLLGEKP